MANSTPLVSSNAFYGTSTSAQRSFLHRKNTPIVPPASATPVITKPAPSPAVRTVPIRLVVSGPTRSTAGIKQTPLAASTRTHFPIRTDAATPTHTIESTPHVPLQPHIVNNGTANHKPQVGSIYITTPPIGVHPSVPRVIRVNTNQSENPPPYETIFNVAAEEHCEPFECPSVLVTGSPRKEKKRSLRSRLLRHITGKKAAEQAKRRNMANGVTKGSVEGTRNSVPRAQLVIQAPNGVIGQQRFATPPSGICNDARYIDLSAYNNLNLTHPMGFEDHIHAFAKQNSNLKSTNHVIVLHSVSEEPSQTSSISQSTVTITTSPSCTVSNTHFVSSQSPQMSTSSTSTVPESSFTNPAPIQTSPEKPEECKNEVPLKPSLQEDNPKVIIDEFAPGSSKPMSNLSKSEESIVHSVPIETDSKPRRKKRPSSVANSLQVEDQTDSSNNLTINLKPGMYKLNLNFANHNKPSQTINFTVPSSDKNMSTSAKPVGRPPDNPEPLYYENSKFSLPKRFVHLLRPTGLGSTRTTSSNCRPKVTVVQQTSGNKNSKVITVIPPGEHQQILNQQASTRDAVKRGFGRGCPTRSHKKERFRLAERKKAEGNEAYRNKDYRDALQHYTQAIDLCPDCAAYYSNRSACYMMLGKYRDALNDAQHAVSLDRLFVKGWVRVGKCHVALGDGVVALSVLRQAQEIEPGNSAVLQEIASAQALQNCVRESQEAALKKDYRTAVFHLDQALRYALGGLDLRITKAEYLTFLGRASEAEDIVNDILVSDSNHADALYVRGLCRYYQDNQDAAFQHFTKVLRLVPDHNKAKETYKRAKQLIQKKEEGNAAFKMGDFTRAMEIYSEALKIDERNKSTNSKLYYNRATVAAKLGRLEQAISDCTSALELDESYIKAYMRRANTYQQTEQYEEAVRDLEKVYRMERSHENKRLLHEAKTQLKRSKRKDYYKILGVTKTATDDEIKKAYRKMALLHHPDRHSSASAAEKAEHERKFKELGEAYAVLTDPKKRSMHDRGQDVNDPDCGGFRDASFDPNQVFEAFFGSDFFASQSHHYYDQAQGPHQQQQQQQFPGQFQGQHSGFQGFPGGFQFGF